MTTLSKLPAEPSYTIREFCTEERISEPTYYKMRALGIGPKELRYLQVVRITHTSRLEWQQQMLTGEFAEAMRGIAARMRARSHDAAVKAVESAAHISNIRRGQKVATPPPRQRQGKRRGGG